MKFKVKLFADGADKEGMLEMYSNPLISGFTTNPTLMKAAGIVNYKAFAKDILTHIDDKPISFEVFSDDFDEMEKQAMEIGSWGDNVYVKIPITNSKGKFMGRVINQLNNKNIKLNITAVYSAKQTKQILNKINKKTKVIISIFAGRMADAGKDPIIQFKNSLRLVKKYKNVEILWASTREPYNFLQAKQLKCHIITVPPYIILKIEKFGKSFQKLTTDTVKGFLEDSKKSRFKI